MVSVRGCSGTLAPLAAAGGAREPPAVLPRPLSAGPGLRSPPAGDARAPWESVGGAFAPGGMGRPRGAGGSAMEVACRQLALLGGSRQVCGIQTCHDGCAGRGSPALHRSCQREAARPFHRACLMLSHCRQQRRRRPDVRPATATYPCIPSHTAGWQRMAHNNVWLKSLCTAFASHQVKDAHGHLRQLPPLQVGPGTGRLDEQCASIFPVYACSLRFAVTLARAPMVCV